MEIEAILRSIFDDNIVTQATSSNEKFSRGANLLTIVDHYMTGALFKYDVSENSEDDRVGRIGPSIVIFDVLTYHGYYGQFIVSTDRLSINSQSNFCTIRANTAVYKGKWMYEIHLGSQGVMQVGWSTAKCEFNEESGVGDTPGSFAYDGNRVKKWNVDTHTYGEPWLSGDIIGCAIDMDNGTIDFYRNGTSLGRAFEKIPMGHGIAYFPTVSLAVAQKVTANFGATPMQYPDDKYEPLQLSPKNKVSQATLLFQWLKQAIEVMHEIKSAGKETDLIEDETMTVNTFLMCLLRSILKYISPLITVPYVCEAVFIPFIKDICNLKSSSMTPLNRVNDASMLILCLDILWSFLQEHEMKECLENSVVQMLSAFRRVPVLLDYPDQRMSLTLLIKLSQHSRTRQYLLQNTLFDRLRIANFLHIRALDEGGLANVVDKVWWETNPIDPSIECYKEHYYYACNKIKSAISEVEALQVDLLVTLLDNSDGTAKTPTSRTIFLRKFRRFMQESLVASRSEFLRSTPAYQITLYFFHRLLAAFRILWDSEIGTDPVYIPCRAFYDGSINYTGIDRLGGVLSHLQKTYKKELIHLLGPEHEVVVALEQPQETSNTLVSELIALAEFSMIMPAVGRNDMLNIDNITGPASSMIFERLGFQNRFGAQNKESKTPMPTGPADPTTSLLELLDGIILFYHVAGKKQVVKMASLRNSMFEYVTAVTDTKARLQSIEDSDDVVAEDVRKELIRTLGVLQIKLSEQARQMAWVRAAIFSAEKQDQFVWLFRTVILTLKSASQEGNMFSFVPDFYLEALSDLSVGIRNHMHPTAPVEEIPGYEQILNDVAEFLCDHFLDPRIVHAHSKDTLILALAGFVSKPCTLQALESASYESRIRLVTNLLKPYENRAWAQSNWVLVRFWQGNGFAFRYDKSPHLLSKVGPKLSQQESISHSIKPCPSSIYQEHVREVLLNNPQATTQFLNFFLNQLNWAFSEFIGMVQEIRNVSSRPGRVFIESRQLKICATCFDLTIALLRVIEMICTIAPDVFSNPAQPSSESLLTRLCQLLCQVLNRMSSQTSCFQHVVLLEIPDLESVDHFPILTAVIGILLALLKEEMSYFMVKAGKSTEIPKITRAILTEPSFQMKSLYFVLGDTKIRSNKQSHKFNDDASTNNMKNVKSFSFGNYLGHITEEEIIQVEEMINHLDLCQSLLPESKTISDDDNTCTICYAFPIAATFKPCKHQTCRACIDRHLLNSRECFFCKVTIDKVVDLSDNIIHDFSNEHGSSSVT